MQTFYSTVFDWTTSPFGAATDPTSEPCIAMFNHKATRGCFIKLAPENLLSPAKHPDNPEKGRIAVRVTISVESIDEKLNRVEEAGGKVYQ